MCRILIFAGTTEGRRLCEYCAQGGIFATVFVASEYGKRILEENKRNLDIRVGRLDTGQMYEAVKELSPSVVVDATHPYARKVTDNIRKACAACGVRLIRLLREPSDELRKMKAEEMRNGISDVDFYVDDMAEASAFLSRKSGNILLTTGSKELSCFQRIEGWKERLYVRVLPDEKVIAGCRDMGFLGRHLIAMQGPFSEEMNYALIREFNVDWLVTKESGRAGGFYEKCAAARRAGASVLVVRRPREEEGCSFEQVCGLLDEMRYGGGVDETGLCCGNGSGQRRPFDRTGAGGAPVGGACDRVRKEPRECGERGFLPVDRGV